MVGVHYPGKHFSIFGDIAFSFNTLFKMNETIAPFFARITYLKFQLLVFPSIDLAKASNIILTGDINADLNTQAGVLTSTILNSNFLRNHEPNRITETSEICLGQIITMHAVFLILYSKLRSLRYISTVIF